MSLSANYPALAPNLLLDFANSNRVDPRITVTRASTATFYDGVTFAKAEENLAVNSQGPAANWFATNVTLTGNNAAAPDGTTTATLANDGAATGAHIAYATATALTASTTYTISAYLKDVTRTYGVLSIAGDGNNYGAVEFNLSTGAVSRTSNITATINSSSITAVGASWYRCVVTVTVGASVATPRSYVSLSDGAGSFDSFGRPSYAGGNLEILVWGAQLEQRSAVTAYTVTTTQPITNYIQALQTAQNNVPRIDHSPTTTATLGLLVEESRTNLVLRSAEFDTASWSKVNSTVSANETIAPDGTLTADKWIPDNGTAPSASVCSQTVTTPAGQYSFSIYAKRAGFSNFVLNIRDNATSANQAYVYVSLINGTSAASTIGTFTGASASVLDAGNGWYRINLTATTGSATAIRARFYQDVDTGNGFSGVFIWGAQLESGAFPTSYIPTVAATVTRQADAISMTGTAFSSWYNTLEGSIVFDYTLPTNIGFGAVGGIGQNTFDTSLRFNINNAARGTGTSFPNTVLVGLAALGANRMGVGMKVNDYVAYINGTLSGTDTTATMVPATSNQFNIGWDEASNNVRANGWIKKVSYYPLRNTNAQLQALTGT